MKRALIRLSLTQIVLAYALPALAGDQVTQQVHQFPSSNEMQWPVFGWVFPVLCIAMLVVMLVFRRTAGMSCMGRGGSTDRSGFRDFAKRSGGEPPASALEMLNERFAKGEIDKQEYEEKKAAIAPSS